MRRSAGFVRGRRALHFATWQLKRRICEPLRYVPRILVLEERVVLTTLYDIRQVTFAVATDHDFINQCFDGDGDVVNDYVASATPPFTMCAFQ